jgi:hypothetical protein
MNLTSLIAFKTVGDFSFKKVSSRIKQLLTTFYGIEEQLALVPIPYTKSRGLLWKED